MGGWVELRTLLQDIDSNNEIDDLKKCAKNGKLVGRSARWGRPIEAYICRIEVISQIDGLSSKLVP